MSNPGHKNGFKYCYLTLIILFKIIHSFAHSYEVHLISFQTFKIVVDSWKFSMLLLYSLWDVRPIFMISGSNEQLQQQLEYTLLKPDCHCWWILKKAIWHFRRTICNKILFETWKRCHRNVRIAPDCFWTILHESSIRDSGKAGSLRGMMRGVGGVRKTMHQSWLVKGLGLGLVCWGFKEVQQEIPSEEASSIQIGSEAFQPGQYTSPQLHPCHRLFDQDGHQHSSSASL